MVPNLHTVARGRNRIAIHEAGHIVVAHHVGVLCRNAFIERDKWGWHGRVRIRQYQPISKAKARKIGVAGAVAEMIWDRASYFNDYVEAISPEDLRLMGYDSDESLGRCWHAIRTVTNLLDRDGPLWPTLIREARRLILEAR